jgi:hypothetical protein
VRTTAWYSSADSELTGSAGDEDRTRAGGELRSQVGAEAVEVEAAFGVEGCQREGQDTLRHPFAQPIRRLAVALDIPSRLHVRHLSPYVDSRLVMESMATWLITVKHRCKNSSSAFGRGGDE